VTGKDTSNAPEKAALLVGSGYGALKLCEDMAQSGIPVVWVTRAPHFLELPGGIGMFEEWPEDLNFQFRPLYLRVTRHPLVTPLTRARVDSIEQSGDGFRAVITRDPLYIDYDLCTGCGECMEVCPLHDTGQAPLSRSPAYCPSRALELDKRKLPACRVECPLGVNVQAYMALAARSRFDEALAVIKETNPLPGICGRVCHHPCEEACRRTEIEQAIAIRDIKRFLADHETSHGSPRFEKAERPQREERVAVVGSGPAGLTAAHFLRRAGLKVTVFESLPQAGGMLRAGINAFRLPRNVLDAEIRAIADEGVEIRVNTTVSSVEELFKQGYKAVLITAGAHCDLRLDVPGEDLDGIVHCVEFLRGVNLEGGGRVGPRTVVIGAGNSAMDAARTALRLGAKEVTVLGIEREHEMPAHPREVSEAREEGVNFRLGAAPIAFEGGDKVERILCRPAHWEFPESGPPKIVFDSEKTFVLEADSVIVSISQRPDLAQCGLDKEIEIGRGKRVKVDDMFSTSREGVFAAGDVVTGPSTVVASMASGRAAAGRIIERLTGLASPFEELTADSRGVGDYIEISEDTPSLRRPEMAQRQPKVRRRDFDEVDFGLTAEQAVIEAGRCLQCGSCCECRVCETVCAEIRAIDHFRCPERIEVISPGVIVADEGEMPEGEFGDLEGLYRIGEVKQDLMDIMVAGSASAGQAMARAARLRASAVPEGRDVTELSDEVRLGVFLCTCNGTMAPRGALERVRDLAERVPGVEHAGLIFSACHPRGADMIADAMKKHGLTRALLASCVCCPLEFQCIACNDQRTRARIHLFDRLKLPRSRFETINLRDHLLAEKLSEDEIVDRARDLLRAAFIRARFMEPLRRGHTEIGRNVLILGGSEIGYSCAFNLDLQGFRVRLVHDAVLKGRERERKKAREKPRYAVQGHNIIHVDRAVIEDIRGHMGGFTVAAVEDGTPRRWRPDIICLTNENVQPLAVHEDMMGLKKLYRYDFAFFHTPQTGLYRVLPRTLKRVSAFEAGAALAAQVAKGAAEAFLKDHLLSPQVDPERCRGCGRCEDICPFDAIRMEAGPDGIYTAEVVRHNCVGCGGCVGRCPVTAMDMPYFSNQVLEEIVAGTLSGDR
jgi:NADPH-dependent glutamate synthase beta subunit-like oxidoreductase/formate hydrogenlyase subunit 6/NADH:ubiquinone oxidoreductase subunit I